MEMHRCQGFISRMHIVYVYQKDFCKMQIKLTHSNEMSTKSLSEVTEKVPSKPNQA